VSSSEEKKELPRLSIPERYRAGIAAFAALPEESFADLLKAMEDNISADTPDLAVEQLVGRFPSIPKSTLTKIIIAITSLQGLDKRSHVPVPVMAVDVAESLYSDSPDLVKEISRDVVKSRVEAVVDSKEINITTAKIGEIQMEVERSFCRARILTDVRAAFSDDASALPTGMTLLHTLQVGYHDETGNHKEFYVTLESDDLKGLKEVIERAEVKKKSLEQLLAKADCKLFE
jgi:hypothetical protein